MFWVCPKCELRVANVAPFSPITCKCGHVDRRGDEQHYHEVDGVKVPPNILRRGANWMRAYLRWVKAGKPLRSERQVAGLRRICSACELFNGKVCTHKRCGCSVVKPSMFGDKLKWGTEHCPIGKW